MKRRFLIAAVAGSLAAALLAPAPAGARGADDRVAGPACTDIELTPPTFTRVKAPSSSLPGGLLGEEEPTDQVVVSATLSVEGGAQRCEGATYNFVVLADADSAPVITTATGTSCPGGGTTSCTPGGDITFSVQITDSDADEFCAGANAHDTKQHVAAYSTWKGSTSDRAPNDGFVSNGPECGGGGFSSR